MNASNRISSLRQLIATLFLFALVFGQSAGLAQRARPMSHPERPAWERSKDSSGKDRGGADTSTATLPPPASERDISVGPLPDTIHPLLREIATAARDKREIKDQYGGLYRDIGDPAHPVVYRLDTDPQQAMLVNRYLSAPISPTMALLPLFDPQAGFGVLRKFGEVWQRDMFRGALQSGRIDSFFAAHQGGTVILVSHINATTRSFDVLGPHNEVIASFPLKDVRRAAALNDVTLMIVGCSSFALGQGTGIRHPIGTAEVAALLPALAGAKTRFDLHRLLSTPQNPVLIDPESLYSSLRDIKTELVERRGSDGVYHASIVIVPPPSAVGGMWLDSCDTSTADCGRALLSVLDDTLPKIAYLPVDPDARENADTTAAIDGTAQDALDKARSDGRVAPPADTGPGFFNILGSIFQGLIGIALAAVLAFGLLRLAMPIPAYDRKDDG